MYDDTAIINDQTLTLDSPIPLPIDMPTTALGALRVQGYDIMRDLHDEGKFENLKGPGMDGASRLYILRLLHFHGWQLAHGPVSEIKSRGINVSLADEELAVALVAPDTLERLHKLGLLFGRTGDNAIELDELARLKQSGRSRPAWVKTILSTVDLVTMPRQAQPTPDPAETRFDRFAVSDLGSVKVDIAPLRRDLAQWQAIEKDWSAREEAFGADVARETIAHYADRILGQLWLRGIEASTYPHPDYQAYEHLLGIPDYTSRNSDKYRLRILTIGRCQELLERVQLTTIDYETTKRSRDAHPLDAVQRVFDEVTNVVANPEACAEINELIDLAKPLARGAEPDLGR